ncbi:hypothetical protein GPJ56_001275 [Histomonas meleagridis]|uniref:uncharacterized protein n=1 Tax=Histomonas meleagridis TaxID=135588 RepID=UPI003559F0BA|nr:hypothetical protein GPJ56_001275 [Histomonas meleagridis]KAH0805032.1 hypothetical protein GO595_001977 [Histomonas meleagridis]
MKTTCTLNVYFMDPWDFIDQDFSEIKSIIEGNDCTLEKVLVHPQFRIAFRRQLEQLILYLSANLTKIFDIAFSDITEDNAEIVSGAVFCLSTPVISFTNSFPSNQEFLQKISNFLNSEYSPSKASTFAMIFTSIVNSTTGLIIISLPEKEKLIPNLLLHYQDPPILSCLSTILNSNDVPIINFREINKTIPTIFNSLKPDDESYNAIIFNLLNDVSKNNPRSILSIATLDTVKRLYEIGFQSNSPNSPKALLLLLNICKSLQDSRNSQTYKNVTEYLFSNSDEICSFIQNGPDFTISKSNATDIVVYFISQVTDNLEKFSQLPIYYFRKLFEYPTNSILHHLFIVLFKYLFFEVDDSSLEEMIKKIPIAFKEYKTINATYWYHLYQATQLICNYKKEPKDDENWNEYMNTIYKTFGEISRANYGGDLPQIDNEYEYYEEEEEEDFETDEDESQ